MIKIIFTGKLSAGGDKNTHQEEKIDPKGIQFLSAIHNKKLES
jgi:hypothetical protein